MNEKNRIVKFYADEEDIPTMIEEMKKIAENFQAEIEEVESSYENTDYSDNTTTNTIDSIKHSETCNTVPESQTNLLLKRIKQQDFSMYLHVVRLLNTIAEKMSIRKVNWKVLRQFLINANAEICMNYMEYNEYDRIYNLNISVGDIVTCNYGRHLEGEVGGDGRMAIVCKKEKGNQIYLVPIMKNNPGEFRMLLEEHEYCVSESNLYSPDNYLLIDRSGYVSRKRIKAIVGKVTPEFLQKVLQQLPKAFDFANTIPSNGTQVDCKEERGNDEIVEDIVTEKKDTKTVQSVFTAKESTGNSEDVGEEEIITYIEDTDAETKNAKLVDSIISKEKDAEKEAVLPKAREKKISKTEEALLEVVGGALDKLDTSKSPEIQIDAFLKEVGIPPSNIVIDSFMVACSIEEDKITAPTLIKGLQIIYQDSKYSRMETKLKNVFKEWLTQYPELKEKCPRISYINLLKVFAKKFAN